MKALILLAIVSFSAFAETPSLFQPGEMSAEKFDFWRFTVSIQTEKSSCTAEWLSTRALLTAKHCVDTSPTMLAVGFFQGSKPWSRESLQTGQYKVSRHPTKDLAIIVLGKDVIPSDDFYAVQIVNGDHITSFNDLFSKTLFVSGAGWTGSLGYAGFFLGLSTGSFSGVRANGVGQMTMSRGQGVCKGDSGSPVTIAIDGGLVLVGTTIDSSADLNSENACGSSLGFELLTADVQTWISRAIE